MSFIQKLRCCNLFRGSNVPVFIVLIVTACAGAPPESIPLEERLAKRGYVIAEPVKRLKDYSINGWNSVDRYNVILILGASLTYLVTVMSPCDGLNSDSVLDGYIPPFCINVFIMTPIK